jgi:hypothetical protein
MTHLTPDELVDIADGVRLESATPHLEACAECRAALAELRAMMSAIADVDVPEPSPLFWDHFSRRVGEAIEAEGPVAAAHRPRAALAGRFASLVGARAFQGAIVAFASLAIVVLVTSRTHAPAPAPGVEMAVAPPASGVDLFSDSPIENDTPLALVATLASNLDVDASGAVPDTGLSHLGSADHAVAHMNGSELRELRRLLQQEMTP